MEPNPSLMLFMLFLLLGLASSSSYISNQALEPSGSTGRNLLQAKTECPINFQDQNYTIITSRCKGPNYPQKICCDAFKQFACAFPDEVNDVNSNCAATMFSYINLYGKYPPGLFANMCKEGNKGLSCVGLDDDPSSGAIRTPQSPLQLLSAASFFMLVCNMF